MNWKIAIKRLIPPSILNNTLLALPFLYRTKIVNFETTIPAKGIHDLLSQLDLVLGLEGNIIECGSSRCGTSIIIARHLRSRGITKLVYACDSFEGFDQDELRRERTSGLTPASEDAFTSTSYQYVQAKIERLGVNDTVIPVKGFFKDTLRHINSKFCFALVDCDLRDSTIYSSESIWPNLVAGGRILFDDYSSEDWKGARLGVDYIVEKYESEIERHGLLSHLYLVIKR